MKTAKSRVQPKSNKIKGKIRIGSKLTSYRFDTVIEQAAESARIFSSLN